ncbi:UNVERIFIED_CONTAM: hypothetical protein PYX00_009498 [Menopon gallinae]|uniref:Uncharacterized protein n=1 Tax=Menopon gallinae TaxID=328185 RepID=A0AAW2HB62_9NEOP
MGTCRGSLYECPYIQKFQDTVVANCNFDFPVKKNNSCDRIWNRVHRASSAKPDINEKVERDRPKMPKSKSNELERSRDEKDDRSVSSSCLAPIRSTRAQDLRSQCNRDLLKPKSVCEKTRVTSPYVTTTSQKKKRSSTTPGSDNRGLSNRSMPTPKLTSEKKTQSRSEKSRTDQSGRKQKREKMKEAPADLQRQKTQELITPKIITRERKDEDDIGDCGDRPELTKSQTFFICKGPKWGEGDDPGKPKNSSSVSGTETCDSDSEELHSPEPNPLTHNDSFCLIAKSSQNWSHKKRCEDENIYNQGLLLREKTKKDDKGILKSSNRDLKSVDSVEKIQSEKIVRFSDELIRKRKVLRKYVRRKNKLQNTITAAWYRKNKMFQKYLQVLKAKSVLHAKQEATSENAKCLQVPVYVRERYEAEMLGIVPRTKFPKGKQKNSNY